MKRYWPFLVMFMGIFLIVGGFIYDGMFAGIPYQDPTPAMSARYACHSHVASMIRTAGGGALLMGTIAGTARFVVGRFARREASPRPV